MLFHITVFLAAIVNMSWAQVQSCKELPRVEWPNNQVFVDNSPYTADFSVWPFPACVTSVFTHKSRGTAGYDGTLVFTQGSSLEVYDLKASNDRKTMNLTLCSTGRQQEWYMAATKTDCRGSFYCWYLCAGDSLIEFGCYSNNKTEFLDEEKEAMALISKVPNGNTIRAVRKDCFTKGCHVFY